MALEVATYISQLDPNWPLGTDKQDRGDDHLRLIKDVLKKTLAGPNGTGWEKAVTVSPDQLNAFNQRITDLENGLKNVYKVNDLMIRADNINPATLYPGTTWTRLNGEFSMYLGNGSNGGTTTGSNSPVVPVPQHNHGATATQVAHSHSVQTASGQTRQHCSDGCDEGSLVHMGSQNTNSVAPGISVTVNNAGTASATIDVRGARMFFNVWKRVS